MLSHSGLIGLGLLLKGVWLGVLLVRCLRLGLFVRLVAFKATLLLSGNLLSRELSMLMQCKTITNALKITPTQTPTTPVGEITQICPTATTTPSHLMSLNLNLLASNTGLSTPHLHNNSSHLSPSLIWRVL